jgi:hypothetical protein
LPRGAPAPYFLQRRRSLARLTHSVGAIDKNIPRYVTHRSPADAAMAA